MSSICAIVAAKDAATTIYRSVASALRQPEVGEVIVVDDGSSDATSEAARAADDGSQRLQVLRWERNRGPSAARNRALEVSRAPLVCVLDADDWVMDGRFAQMLAQGGDWDLLADDLFLAEEARPDQPTGRLIGLEHGAVRSVDALEFVRSNISDPKRPRRELGYLKPLMRRAFLDEAQLSYDEGLRLGEDFILYAQALLRGARFKLTAACGYVAVQRAGSLSHSHGAADLQALWDADGRLVQEARRDQPEVAAALTAHRASVRRNLDFRKMLDAKKQGDWVAVAGSLLRTPQTTAYIVGQVVRDKTARARG